VETPFLLRFSAQISPCAKKLQSADQRSRMGCEKLDFIVCPINLGWLHLRKRDPQHLEPLWQVLIELRATPRILHPPPSESPSTRRGLTNPSESGGKGNVGVRVEPLGVPYRQAGHLDRPLHTTVDIEVGNVFQPPCFFIKRSDCNQNSTSNSCSRRSRCTSACSSA
jgi:hypothetical protein